MLFRVPSSRTCLKVARSTLACLLLTTALCPDAKATEPSVPDVWLGNIRTQRAPTAPFVWSGKGVDAWATATAPRTVPGRLEAEWTVQVVLQAKQGDPITAVRLPADSAAVLLEQRQEGDAWHVRLQAKAQKVCNQRTQSRTYLQLEVTRSPGEAPLVVAVDHLCLLGEMTETDPGNQLARLASRGSGPVEELADEIRGRIPAGHGQDLVVVQELLKRSLRERGGSYRQDPALYVGGLGAREPYLLLPDETLRYGGDCEDWALLSTAVLRRLGFDAAVVFRDSHAYAVVKSGAASVAVDYAQLTSGPAGLRLEPGSPLRLALQPDT